MSNTFFTKISGNSRDRLQAYILLGFGLIFMLGALFLHPSPFAVPIGLLFFGLGILLSAIFNPARLTIAGVIFTLIGAVIFIAFKPIIPYDSGLAVIASGLALITIAFLTRRGYIGKGAVTPGILILLVGLLLYQPTGREASKFLAPFILSLWFPGVMLFLIGLIYYVQSIRKHKTE
jgi:hypothetical protein